MRKIIYGCCLIFFSFQNSYGQDFIKKTDKTRNVKVITFEDRRTPVLIPIIINKTTFLDRVDSPSVYDIGLYLLVMTHRLNFFMETGGGIVFEDGSSIMLKEEILSLYISGGNHQIAIKHRLIGEELRQLQTKKINYITIGDIEVPIDRYQKDPIKAIFNDIEKER